MELGSQFKDTTRSRTFTPIPVGKHSKKDPDPRKAGKPKLSTRTANQLVTNASDAFKAASPRNIEQGKRFYPEAHGEASRMADALGVTTADTSAAFARTSPKTMWEVNQMQTRQLARMSDKQFHHIDAAAALVDARSTLPKAHPERDRLTKEIAKARYKAGAGAGTPLGTQSTAAIHRASQHIRGQIENPLDTLGKVKINDFGRTIANPEHPGAPVDTHYHDALVGRTDIEYKTNRALSTLGRYKTLQEAGEKSRKELIHSGAAPESLSSSEHMARIWHFQQDLKQERNGGAGRSEKANLTKLRNLDNHPRAAEWSPF